MNRMPHCSTLGPMQRHAKASKRKMRPPGVVVFHDPPQFAKAAKREISEARNWHSRTLFGVVHNDALGDF